MFSLHWWETLKDMSRTIASAFCWLTDEILLLRLGWSDLTDEEASLMLKLMGMIFVFVTTFFIIVAFALLCARAHDDRSLFMLQQAMPSIWGPSTLCSWSSPPLQSHQGGGWPWRRCPWENYKKLWGRPRSSASTHRILPSTSLATVKDLGFVQFEWFPPKPNLLKLGRLCKGTAWKMWLGR